MSRKIISVECSFTICLMICLLGSVSCGQNPPKLDLAPKEYRWLKEFAEEHSSSEYLELLPSIGEKKLWTDFSVPNWIHAEDAVQAFAKIHDPTCCWAPILLVSSSPFQRRSSVGFESQRIILCYIDGDGHYPCSLNEFQDVESLKNRFREKYLSEIGGELTWPVIEEQIQKNIARSMADTRSKLLVTVTTEDEIRVLNELELEALVNETIVLVNDKELNVDQLTERLAADSIHHLILKVPSNSKVTHKQVRNLVSKIKSRIKHVDVVEIALTDL